MPMSSYILYSPQDVVIKMNLNIINNKIKYLLSKFSSCVIPFCIVRRSSLEWLEERKSWPSLLSRSMQQVRERSWGVAMDGNRGGSVGWEKESPNDFLLKRKGKQTAGSTAHQLTSFSFYTLFAAPSPFFYLGSSVEFRDDGLVLSHP